MFRYAAAASAAVAALALGMLAASLWYAPRAQRLEAGVILDHPRPVADFSLTDQDGRPFTGQRLHGAWHLVFVGFTHCPDVCPTTLSVVHQVEQALAAEGRPLRTVFVSVDPVRDTPERLKRYVRHFSPTLTGVTGATDQLERLCASLGVAYVKVPGASEDDYTIDHTAALVLIDPQGRVAGYFQAPHKTATLTADLSRVIPRST